MEHLSVNKLLEGLPRGGLGEEAEQVFTKILAKYKGGAARDKALSQLVLSHMRDAFFYARRCCNGKLADDEIFSLCYSALERAAHRHHYSRGRFFAYAKPYLRGAIYRKWKTMDAVRGAGRTESLDAMDCAENDADIDPINSEDTIADPEFELVDLREKWELVKPLMARLSASERRVLELHYSGGMNFREVADLMGVTRSATQGTHSRALRKIRNALLRKGRLYE